MKAMGLATSGSTAASSTPATRSSADDRSSSWMTGLRRQAGHSRGERGRLPRVPTDRCGAVLNPRLRDLALPRAGSLVRTR